MSFDNESSEKLELKLENQYKSIFDELTAIFDRYQDTETPDAQLRYSELDINIRKVSNIISEYWNIPIDLVVSDFNFEILRKKENQMEIPDVPTYQIRFALEEGSWIILLRVNFPRLLKPLFSRLITLEDIIFKTGKGVDDDCAYYLIEIDQISKQWISALSKFWVLEHEFSKEIDSTIRSISAIYNVHPDRGKEIYAGSIRLMHVKLTVLSRVNQIETSSNWALNAKSLFVDLKNQLDEGKYSKEVLNLFITLSVLQKEIIQIETIKSDENEKGDTIQYSIAEAIGWDKLLISDDESVDLFSDNLMYVLYDLPHNDPETAAEYLLSQFFDEIKLDSNIGSKYSELLKAKIEMSAEQFLDAEERDKIVVEVIEDFLPSMFIQIKNEIEFEKPDPKISKLEILATSEMWANFEAQLLRLKRIDDPVTVINTFKRIIRSNYDLLINESLLPINAVDLLLSNFMNTFTVESTIRDNIMSRANSIIENGKNEGISMVIIDQNLIDLIYDELQSFII